MTSTAFKIHYTSYREEDSSFESDPDDNWSRPNTYTHHTIEGVSLVLRPHADAFDCTAPFAANAGQKVYVVAATYSSGDSFGHDQGEGIEFISVFQTPSKAQRCKEQLQAHTDLCNMRRNYRASSQEDIEKIMGNLAVPVQKKTDKDGTAWDLSEWDYKTQAYYQDESDALITCSLPWIGYFESLDQLEVYECILKPDAKLVSSVSKRKIK